MFQENKVRFEGQLLEAFFFFCHRLTDLEKKRTMRFSLFAAMKESMLLLLLLPV